MTLSPTQQSQRPSWWELDTRRTFVLILFIALFAMSAREITDPDFWWHLKTGEYILDTRSIPHQDVFSFTVPGRTWITHEWLTQVGMIALYRVGGLGVLALVTSAIITATFGLVYVQCDGRPHLAAFAVLLGALASAVTWGARPQMLNMTMAALLSLALLSYRRSVGARKGLLWAFPAITALWVNLHSGFFLGLFILVLTIAGDLAAHLFGHHTEDTLPLPQIGALALALAASIAASLLNPNGAKMLWYPFETLGSGAMQTYIQEWASPDWHRVEYWPAAALLLGGAATLGYTRRKRDLSEVATFFAFALASMISARHIPLFAVLAVPIVTRYAARIEIGRLRWRLARAAPSRRPPSRWMVAANWVLVAAVVVSAGGWTAHILSENQKVEATYYPVEALAYIESNGLADARIYNSYNWGGYLIWRGYPVFIDGRADVYMDEFMDEYVEAYQLRGNWRRPLDRYNVDVVLIESDSSLATLLTVSEEWVEIYRDEMAAIFDRR
jgi:hypothetical protein